MDREYHYTVYALGGSLGPSYNKRPQCAESSGQKVLPTQTERKRVGTAPGGSRADSASAATRAIAHRAPAGRRQPALRSRDAHSPPCRTSGAQSAPYAACWSANHHASRELTTKRTIGADPLSNRKRVRRPRSAFVELLLGRAIGGPPGPTRWRAGGRHARPRSRLADDPFGGRPPNTAAAVATSSSRRQEQRPPTAPATLTAPCPRPHCRRCRRRRCRRRRRRRHRRRSPSSPLQHWPPPPRRRHAGCAAQYHASLVA